MGKQCDMSDGLTLLRRTRGAQAKVARELGVTRAAVAKWEKIPAERVVEVERVTGIPREELRPDLYRIALSSDVAAPCATDSMASTDQAAA